MRSEDQMRGEQMAKGAELDQLIRQKLEGRGMSSEWPTVLLGELTENFDTRRKPVKQSERRLGPYPYYGASGVVDHVNGFLFDGDYLLIAEDGENLRTRQTPIAFLARGKFWVNNHAHIVTGNAKASTRYLEYALLDTDISAYLTGAVMPKLTQGNLNRIEVQCPPRAIQDEIVGVLGTLDDRIALLRETNATLEAITQALFKSWFVDFDPVRAKMEGRTPEGMDEATSALFPDVLENSPIGDLPRGWGSCPVYELANYINGAAYKAFEPNAERRGRPIIKIAELKVGVTTQTAYSAVAMADKYLIDTGDILFSWSGNPDTSIDTFVWAHEPAWLNQHIFRVLPHSPQQRSFVLQLLRYLRPVFAELARNKQTTGLGHVTVADMKRLLVVQPTVEVVEQFAQVAAPLHARIFANERQALSLATLRDTLLPRLISGQLRLPDPEPAASALAPA
jgi:type I restriction enzyme S subunit